MEIHVHRIDCVLQTEMGDFWWAALGIDSSQVVSIGSNELTPSACVDASNACSSSGPILGSEGENGMRGANHVLPTGKSKWQSFAICRKSGLNKSAETRTRLSHVASRSDTRRVPSRAAPHHMTWDMAHPKSHIPHPTSHLEHGKHNNAHPSLTPIPSTHSGHRNPHGANRMSMS
jgi:hypothetical protein